MTGILNAIIAGVSGAVKDTYFNLVSLLLPGNGTNGAQNNTFLDGSSNNFTITRNGNTTQGTFSPFSQTGWGAYFDGSNDSLTVSSNAAFGFGTGDFCVEFWMYPTALTTARGIYLTNATGGLYIYTDTSNKLIVRASAVATLITSNDAISLNTWTHVAVCRTGTTLSLYLNGSRTAGGTASNSTNFAAGDLYIGVEINTFYYSGYLGSLRAVKGSAVYDPTATTITVPTAPLSAVSGTSLLTCQYNRFRDASSNGFTVTPNNGVAITPFSPFAPTAAYTTAAVGGSGYFDGTGDYLSVANSSALAFGTNDFTVEFWSYLTAAKSPGSGMAFIHGTASSNSFGISTDFINVYGFTIGGSGVSFAYVPQINRWTHYAFVRSSGSARLYVDGVQIGSAQAYTTNITGLTGSTYIGAETGPTNYYTGYLTGVRYVNGTAVYTTAFTPPTSPLTAITNTSLLLNFTNAGITDATAKNDLETVGNAQISTTQSKWGGSSMYFDGTGDYLVPNSANSNVLLGFGTGDFTIEFWVYFAGGLGSDILLYDGRPLSTNGAYPTLYVNSSSQISYVVSSADRITSASAFSTSIWYHVAVARSGTSTKMFVNGTQVGSTYTDSTSYLSAARRPTIAINGFNESAGGLNGYIDDLRVTRYARYTANFTAPTAPFPVQ